MTVEAIRSASQKADLYRTPELNNKLYLHYYGFQSIECLDRYTGTFFFEMLHYLIKLETVKFSLS